MKQSFLALIFILTTALTAMAQATQPCVVKQYNQKQQKTPLAGVQVEVRDAGSAASGSDGRLTLSFRTLKPGDRVPFRAATKAGYELMNKDAVEQWNISRDQKPFEIVLIQSAYFTQLKSNLKQSSVDSYHQKYEQTLAELEKLKKDGKLKEQEYNDKLNELEDRYDSQLKNLDAYVDQFARIDLSELSEQEQQFIELAHAGRLDEAAEAYNSLNAAGKFITAVENVRRLNEGIAKLEDEKAKQQEAADAFFAMLLRQVNTLKLAGGEENYRKAGELLKRAALADTTNIKVVEEYADFVYNQKDYEDTERFFLICLNNCGNDLKRQAAIQNNLGNLYTTLRDYAKSEEYKLKSLETFTQLFNHNPDAYRSLLSGVQNNLAILYSDIQDYSQAEYYYFKALENRTMLYLQNPEIYRNGLADTQDGLGSLYSNLHDYAKAEEYYLKALENRTLLFTQDPYTYREMLAGTQNNLGILYQHLKDYTKAKEFFIKALENKTLLFTQNPDAYREDLSMTQHNLGIMYYYLHDYAKAEEYYFKALEHRKQLFCQNPDAHCNRLAASLKVLGILYSDLHDYAKAEEYYLMALENYIHMFALNPEKYRVDLAKTQTSIMLLYGRMENWEKFDEMLEQALKNYEELAQHNSKYQEDLVLLRDTKQQRVAQRADFAKKSAINYYNNHDYIQSEEYFLQALENYIQLYTLNPNTYLGELASTQFYLGILYSDLHDYIKAEEFYLMALENHKILFEKQPEIYHEKLAWLEYSLMMVYTNLDNNLNQYEVMLDAALANFEALYQSNKQFQSVIVDLRNRKGLQYLNSDKIDEAMALFESSYLLDPIETLPFLISGCNAKAYEYAKAGDYDKAIESIDRAISLMPEEANLYDSKGEILLMKGDEQEAVMMWKKVLELDPEFLQKHEGETDFYKQLKEKRLIE